MRYPWNAAEVRKMVRMLAQPLALMLALMLAHALARVLSSCQHYCRKPRDARGLAAPLARACRPRDSAQGGHFQRTSLTTYTRESRLKSIASRIQPRPGLPAGSRPPRAAHRPAAARNPRRMLHVGADSGRAEGPSRKKEGQLYMYFEGRTRGGRSCLQQTQLKLASVKLAFPAALKWATRKNRPGAPRGANRLRRRRDVPRAS